jgi:hypothetical protein
VVDPGLLEREPPCLARPAGRDQAQPEIFVQDTQCRRRVDRFPPDQVVNVIEGYSSAVM